MPLFIIVRDEGGVVRIDKRPTPLKDVAITGKKIIDVVRDAGNAVNPVTLSSKYGELGAAVIDAERSDRLTPEERAQIRASLVTFDFITDSVRTEVVPGEFARTHSVVVVDENPVQRRTLLNPLIDP